MIQQPRLGFRQMPVGQTPVTVSDLLAAERPAQPDLIADFQQPVRLAALAVDLDLAALAGALCLRSRAIETRDVEPDVESDRWSSFRSSLNSVANHVIH